MQIFGIMREVSALAPRNISFLQDEALHEMSAHCGCVDEDLRCELR